MTAIRLEFTDLIGKPFEYGGRGPDVYDCWGLVMELHKRQGIQLPDYKSPEAWRERAKLITGELVLWDECEEKPGVVILIHAHGEPVHVGMYIRFGRFIHAHESCNVAIDNIRFWKEKIVGYYTYRNNN